MRIQRNFFRKLERKKTSTLGKIKKIFFMNFEYYDFTIHMVNVYKNWCTYGNTN